MIELIRPNKKDLRLPAYKSSIDRLNLDACKNTPSFRKTGIQLFEKKILITPHNFPQISYLNIEASRYSYKTRNRYSPHLWRFKGQVIQRHMELMTSHLIFEVFENEMFAKMKDKNFLSLYMRKYLSYLKVTKRCFDELDAKRIYLTLSCMLINLKNEDSLLITDLLKTVFVTQSLKDFFLFESACDTNFMCYLIDLARICKFDMWGLLADEPQFEKFPVCPILGCLLTGHYCRMEVLLKFGFQRIPTKSFVKIYQTGFRNPLYRRYGVLELLHQMGIKISLPRAKLDTFALHRIFLAVEMMYVLCKILSSADKDWWKWVKCYEYIWRSIPDPHLCHYEMQRILRSLSNQSSANSINNLCIIYRNMFFKANQQGITPRSLQHLCRCFIRSRLRQNFSLPEGLDLLPLPRSVIAFLNLES